MTYLTSPPMVKVADTFALTALANVKPDAWFNAEQHLGRRGHKYLSMGTKYWLAAAGGLTKLEQIQEAPNRIGIVVGTNFGAHRTLCELHQVAQQSGSLAISPLGAPNFCVNLIAGYAGIRYRAQRFNLTLTTPQVAGLDALNVAAMELRSGRCNAVLAGASEEAVDCDVQSEPRLQGAIALLLTLAGGGAVGSSHSHLSAFFECHVPSSSHWFTPLDIVVERMGKKIAESIQARSNSLRIKIVTDCSSLFSDVEAMLFRAGVRADRLEHSLLSPSHGCLEPLWALHELLVNKGVAVYVYANKRGAVRCLVLNA
jgi:hypothetical protein